MSYLGGFLLGQAVTFGVTWTLAPGEPAVTGTVLTLTHEDGTVLGPFDAASAGGNAWRQRATPTRRGRWEVEWRTVPAGGVTEHFVYVS